MAELKQTLAAGGYYVTKNNRRVNVVTKRLVNNETLVRTTRNASFRLNNTVKEPLHISFGNLFAVNLNDKQGRNCCCNALYMLCIFLCVAKSGTYLKVSIH